MARGNYGVCWEDRTPSVQTVIPPMDTAIHIIHPIHIIRLTRIIRCFHVPTSHFIPIPMAHSKR